MLSTYTYWCHRNDGAHIMATVAARNEYPSKKGSALEATQMAANYCKKTERSMSSFTRELRLQSQHKFCPERNRAQSPHCTMHASSIAINQTRRIAR